MGYSDISIGGSDMASDTLYVSIRAARENGIDAAIPKLREELEGGIHSFCNTPGVVNVALVLVDAEPDYQDPDFVLRDLLPEARGYRQLVRDTLNKLTELRAEWADADWGDAAVRRRDGSDNKKYHLDAVDRLLAGLRRLDGAPTSPDT